jgi:predicted TIM-barrel fold metal-dependent hydrolase
MKKTIMQLAGEGLAFNNRIVIDAHAHLGKTSMVHAAYGDVQGLLASMNRIGIRITCISAFQSLGGDIMRGNDAVAGVIKQYPGRFVGYGTLNPLFPKEIIRELERCLDNLGLWAIKLHPTMHRNTPPDDPIYHMVYASMQERRGVVLSHTFGTPQTLDELSTAYPDVVFIYAHVGGTFDESIAKRLAPLLQERNNIYIDTVLSVVPYGHIEQWVALAGSDKLLFGSDVPFNDNAHQIGRLTHSRLDEKDKEKILGLNMQKLLKRTGGWTEAMDIPQLQTKENS